MPPRRHDHARLNGSCTAQRSSTLPAAVRASLPSPDEQQRTTRFKFLHLERTTRPRRSSRRPTEWRPAEWPFRCTRHRPRTPTHCHVRRHRQRSRRTQPGTTRECTQGLTNRASRYPTPGRLGRGRHKHIRPIASRRRWPQRCGLDGVDRDQ